MQNRPRTALRTALLSTIFAATLSACGGDDADITSRIPDKIGDVTPGAPISAAMLAQIDDYAMAQLSRQQIPGMSIVVTRNGKPVLQKGYGVASLAQGTPATADTVYRIGSLTKQFTASAIMLLVQDGRLKLDQPVREILPSAPASWQSITVRHLLTHTSGLSRDVSPELLDKIDPTHLPSMDQLVAMAGEAPLTYATGSAHQYSNLGYHLLGFVIEKVSGQHYAQFLRQRVFDPLGMTSADVIHTARPLPAMASGYTRGQDGVKPASTRMLMPGLVEAEGGLQMSANDLAKWDAALNSGRILSQASLAQMWAPARLNDGTSIDYGLGWGLGSINGSTFVHHNGLIEGFTSEVARHAREGISIIVLVNSDVAMTGRVVSRIRAVIEPRLDWTIAADPRPQTGTLLRTMVEQSARGVLQADDRFSPQFKAFLTPEVLQSFTDYLQPWAPIEQFGYIDQVSINGVQVSRYLVRSKYDQAILGVALDPQGRVAYLNLLSE